MPHGPAGDGTLTPGEISKTGLVLKIGRRDAGQTLPARSGETVTVTILRKQSAGQWLVSIRGGTYVARSTVPLETGSTHRALVGLGRGEMTLRLNAAPADLAELLQEAHLPSDGFALESARALMRAGLGVTADRMEKLRETFRGTEGGLSRKLRAGSEILKKIPDASPSDVARLAAVFSAADQGGGGGGRERGGEDTRKDPDSEDVRKGLLGEGRVGGEEGRDADLLRLFNHRADGSETWIVLPCRFRLAAGSVVSGSVRLLMDTRTHTVRCVVVEATRDGEPTWWFHLAPGRGGDRCRVWRDGQSPDPGYLSALQSQLGKTGVRIADTLGDGARFDGFSPVERLPGPIDLIG